MGHCLSSYHNFSYCKQMYCHLHCLKIQMTYLLPIHQVLPCCAVYEVLGKFSHKVATGGQKSCEPIFRLTQSLHLLFRSSNSMNTRLQLLTSVRVLQNLLPTRFFAERPQNPQLVRKIFIKGKIYTRILNIYVTFFLNSLDRLRKPRCSLPRLSPSWRCTWRCVVRLAQPFTTSSV